MNNPVRSLLVWLRDGGRNASGAPVVCAGAAGEGTPAATGKTGICLSGGGIRSAAFGLGALQAFSDHGMLRGPKSVDYLSAVSGGSYIAGAYTMLAKGPYIDPTSVKPPRVDRFDLDDGVVPSSEPFERGGPEEQFLRNHTAYLTHGGSGIFGFVGHLLGGIALNLLFLAVTLHTFGRFLGWGYGWLYPSLRGSSNRPRANVGLLPWIIPACVILAAAGALLGLVWIGVRWRRLDRASVLSRLCALLLAAAAVLWVAGFAIPVVLELLRNHLAGSGRLPITAGGPPVKTAGEAAAKANGTLGRASVAGLGGLLLTVAGALRLAIAAPGVRQAAEGWLKSLLRRSGRRIAFFALNLAASLFGPVLLLCGALYSISLGAADTPFGQPVRIEIAWVVGSAGLMLVMFLGADLMAWSLHPVYKRRLASAFALRRIERRDAAGHLIETRVEARPYERLYPLSTMQPDTGSEHGGKFPALLICAAANVSDYGRTPTGANVTSFVFSAETIGGPLVGAMATADYEDSTKRRARDITLPAAVSITGAAISPSMGRMTMAPLRFILALTNLRLGVWLPNPALVQQMRTQDASRQFVTRPLMNYLFRELFGKNHLGSRFLYVSDGGHYENLGLVELLRRGCTTIWCVDSSGEQIGTFGTIAEAVAIARAELGVEIDIIPENMGPDPDGPAPHARFVRATHCHGRIRYQDGTEGDLVVVKAGVPADAPLDVLGYHKGHVAFPCDPTYRQFFDADAFDAYRALGRFATERALTGTYGDAGSLAPQASEAPDPIDLDDGAAPIRYARSEGGRVGEHVSHLGLEV